MRFMSRCAMASRAPYTMAITESTRIVPRMVGSIAAAGKSGIAKRRIAYAPTFMPSVTAANVGAEPCASGSHVWNGTSADFTAKARKKAPNIQSCVRGVSSWAMR